MKNENKNGVATRNTAAAKKDAEVTCWNCLSSESFERDVEPIPLSKVRKQHRDKLRLYSFIASQVSKPRAVPLKQRVSENYSVAKKLDEKISEEQRSKNLTENFNQEINIVSELNDHLDPKWEGNRGQKVADLVNENIFTDNISQRFNDLKAEVKKFPEINASLEKLEIQINDSASNNNSSHHFLNVSGEFKDLSDFNRSHENSISKPIYSSHSKVDINQSVQTLTAENNSLQLNIKPETNLIKNDDKILTDDINHRVQPLSAQKELSKLDSTPEKVVINTENYASPSDIKQIIYTSTDQIVMTELESVPDKVLRAKEDNNFGTEIKQRAHILSAQKELPQLDISPGKVLRKEDDKTLTGDVNQRVHTLSAEKVLPKFDNTYGKILRNVNDKTYKGDINESSQTLSVELEEELDQLNAHSDKLVSKIDSTYTTNENQRLPRVSHEKKSLEKTPEKSSKKIDDNTLTNELKLEHQSSSSENQDPYKINKIPEEVKVLNKVLVETSTPRKKRALVETNSHKYSTLIEFKKKDDTIEELSDETDGVVTNSGRISSISVTSDKVDNASCSGSDSGYAESSIAATESKDSVRDLSSPEPTSLTSDKIDNASCSGSDCGYPESSSTAAGFKENVRDHASPGFYKNEPLNKSCLRQNFKSSLPSLPTTQRLSAKSTTSLYPPMSPTKKTSEKYIRWSTLSIHQKPIAFGDETYVSDSVSPGHATLPRRSNSPLPHERDLGDRYSLNRSGLQARSESMASVYSGAGEGMRGNVTVRGDVQFSLLYNYRLGALEVGVRRCRDLAPVDTKRNRSDPYVKVYLLPDKSKTGKRKTKVKKNTLNPVFEETLSFVQPLASLSARTLWLSVWHADMFGRNDFLGEVTLPLADVVFDDAAPMWYKLHERTEQFDEQQGTRGDLIIGLKFEMPETGPRAKGTLHVLVKEAKNVVATKPNGLADVFCKSYLLPERGRLAKQKTTVCRRTLCPRWEHTFTYRGLTMQELATRALELSLWDRDRLASNDFMGAVRLSLGTGTYMGASVNWMDSAGKEVTLWQTMMQRPNFWVEGSLPLRPQLNN